MQSTHLLNSLIEANPEPEMVVYYSNNLDFSFIKQQLATSYARFVVINLKLCQSKN